MKLRHDLAAGLAGNGWSAVMGIAFIPAYMAAIGPEGYGLVGVFVSLTAAFAVLDLGLAQSLNKTLAQLSSEPDDANRMAHTVKTLEVVYLGAAVLIFALVALLSGPIARWWLQPQALSQEAVQQSIILIGLAIAARWPISLFSGGLQGLHKHVVLNTALMAATTVQALGALAVLYLVSPTIQAFLIWQVIAGVMHSLLLRQLLYQSIPSTERPAFHARLLKSLWQFAAGVLSIALLSTVLTQLDKFILSRMLSLSDFGYYAFASAVASVLFRITTPIFNVYFPRFSQAVGNQQQDLFVHRYHQACQLMAMALVPASLTLAYFSHTIILLWSSNAELAGHVFLLVTVLSIGNMLNGLLYIPYAAQLASNITWIALRQNLIAIVVFVPAVYWSASRWGALGAAWCWVGLNIGYMLVAIPVMHRFILQNRLRRWYTHDVAIPIGLCVGLLGIVYWLSREISGSLASLAIVGTSFLLVLGVLGSVSRNLLGEVPGIDSNT